MPIELSSSFDYITGGIIKSRFFSNPIWIATIITLIISIIIFTTQSSSWWIQSIYVFIGSLFVIFIYTSALLKKHTSTAEITGAAEILGNLAYVNNPNDISVTPTYNLSGE